jgi:hypothetical protein
MPTIGSYRDHAGEDVIRESDRLSPCEPDRGEVQASGE